MPKTITKTVYTFRELLRSAKRKNGRITERAVAKARDWLREGQTDHDWWEFVYETWKQAMEQIGFTNPEINFSGFWSPGDGASFESGLDFEKLIAFLSAEIEPENRVGVDDKGNEQFLNYVVHKLGRKTTDARLRDLLCVVDYLSGHVERTCHQYSHENTCRAFVEGNFEGTDELVEGLANVCLDGLVPALEEAVEDLRKSLCRVIYRELEAEHEYLTADEQLIEASDANDYTFDESGDIEF